MKALTAVDSANTVNTIPDEQPITTAVTIPSTRCSTPPRNRKVTSPHSPMPHSTHRDDTPTKTPIPIPGEVIAPPKSVTSLLINALITNHNIQLLLCASMFAYFALSMLVDWLGLYLLEHHSLPQHYIVELMVWLEVFLCIFVYIFRA